MFQEDVYTLDDGAEWDEAVAPFPAVFATQAWAQIQAQQKGYIPRLYRLAGPSGALIYPFFLRPLTDLPFWGEATDAVGHDIMTPEYTGPHFCSSGPGAAQPQSDLVAEFRRRFHDYCQRNQLVAEFAHLHPWDAVEPALVASGIALNRQIVYVDLAQPESWLWENSFDRACRKNIRRALREDLELYIASQPEDIEQFHRIYTMTMDRNDALTSYYFPLDYFHQIAMRMPDACLYVFARSQGQVVAATLYLYDDDNVYSYLGGADHQFASLRPTNGVVYTLIQWAQARGIKRLILGGGYAPDDGIFRFKQTFSPLTADFKIYRQIHLPEKYAELQALHSQWVQNKGAVKVTGNYFPSYREHV